MAGEIDCSARLGAAEHTPRIRAECRDQMSVSQPRVRFEALISPYKSSLEKPRPLQVSIIVVYFSVSHTKYQSKYKATYGFSPCQLLMRPLIEERYLTFKKSKLFTWEGDMR